MLKIINTATVRRSFEMVIGLQEGYKGKKLHSMELVEKLIGKWLVKQKRTGKPYIPGRLDYNTMLYVHDDLIVEPVAIYKGEINPIYNFRLSDKAAIVALTELAQILADELKQTRIYLSYRDKLFILENK